MRDFKSGRFDPCVRETTKVAEIKDNFGRTRYKVALTDFDDQRSGTDSLASFDTNFQITVVSYCYGEEPLTIVEKYEDDFGNAVRLFNQYVEAYSALSKAETRDYQDISVWASKTGYHKICPNCCAVCEYAVPVDKSNSVFGDWKTKYRGKFICENSGLYGVQERQDAGFKDIRPVVDADGICDGFSLRVDPKYHADNHSEYTFRNHDTSSPENLIETIAKFEFSNLTRGLEDKIISDVGTAIEKQMEINPPIIEGNRPQDEIIYSGGGAD